MNRRTVTGEEVAISDKARGYETADDEFLLVVNSDIERARRERPPLGALATPFPPSKRESPPTAPTGPHEEQEDKSAAKPDDIDDEEQQETDPSLGHRTHARSRSAGSFQRARSTPHITRGPAARSARRPLP